MLSDDTLKTSDKKELTYKRVSGFKVMDSIKAFITIQRQKAQKKIYLIKECT